MTSTAVEDLTVDFIIVQESQHALETKARVKLQVPRVELALFGFEEISSTEIFDNIGIPLSSEDKEDLLFAISRRSLSMPRESDHLFVCIVTKTEEPTIDMFNITTGIHVDEDKAISWDLVEEPFNEVLQACKPPIPCLKKMKIQQRTTGLNEDLSCAICLQDILVGSEAAYTTCSHVYHCQCIVKWLMKSASCPLCRCRLPVA